MENENDRKAKNRDELIHILKEHPELFETALNLILEELRNPAAQEGV